jgi:tyrosine-protein phosphatase SIW14
MSRINLLTITLPFLCLPTFAATVPGIKNFDQVDAHVYRGAQPSDEGFAYLAKIGVKTIIDLRETGSRSKAEERTVSGAGMKYISVPMGGLTPPTDSQITRILNVLNDDSAGPVFVHCRRGADRTGAVIGAYHIQHDQWDNARALQDAKAHSMSFFQVPRQNFLLHYKAATVEAEASPATGSSAALVPALAAAQ